MHGQQKHKILQYLWAWHGSQNKQRLFPTVLRCICKISESDCQLHVLSVRPSVCRHGTKSAPNGRIFIQCDIWRFSFCLFEKSVQEIQMSPKSDMKNGYPTWRHALMNVNTSKISSKKCSWQKLYKNPKHTTFCDWINIDQLDVTCFIISLFTAQHVSNVSTSIFRSLRLIVDLFHVLYCSGSMCVGVTVWFGSGGVVSLCWRWMY